jgi:signal transduction histidine kinase
MAAIDVIEPGITTRSQLQSALLRQKTMTHLRLGDALVQENLITAAQRDAALAFQAQNRHQLLGEILVGQGVVTAGQVRRVLVEQLGVPSVDLARFPSDPSADGALTEALAWKFTAVALYRAAGRIGVAMENPTWHEALRQLETATGLKVDAVMASREDLVALIEKRHGPSSVLPLEEAGPVDAVERLRVLSARVLSIQEEERRHISRDLHDDVGQSLTALKFGLHRLVPHTGGESLEILDTCIAMADATLERVRQLAYDMRPPQLDELGLEEALRALVERQREATGLDIKCHFNGLKARRFPEGVESACYRITQEALSNATRHAQARSILVTLEAGAQLLRLTVRDDGRGIDKGRLARPSTSLGLIGMEERAALASGLFEVGSELGQGTMIRVTFRLAAVGEPA